MVAGAAAVATLVGDQWRAGLAASLAGALSRVFGIAERARRHADPAQQHGHLAAEIAGADERDFNEADINRWCAKLAQVAPVGAHLFEGGLRAALLLGALLLGQYFLAAIAARNNGIRFVTDVLAIHSAKRVTATPAAKGKAW